MREIVRNFIALFTLAVVGCHPSLHSIASPTQSSEAFTRKHGVWSYHRAGQALLWGQLQDPRTFLECKTGAKIAVERNGELTAHPNDDCPTGASDAHFAVMYLPAGALGKTTTFESGKLQDYLRTGQGKKMLQAARTNNTDLLNTLTSQGKFQNSTIRI